MENKDARAREIAQTSTIDAPTATSIAPAGEGASPGRYSRVAVVLHWSIATLIIFNLVNGLIGANTEGDFHRQALDWHKPLGILILLLSLVRLGWRLGHRPPAYGPPLGGLEKALAALAHGAFYAVMIVQPMTGWWLSSAVPTRHPFGWLGVLEVPFLPVTQSMASAGAAHTLHVWVGLSTIGLLALHLAGVIKHQFLDHHDLLRRMGLGHRS